MELLIPALVFASVFLLVVGGALLRPGAADRRLARLSPDGAATVAPRGSMLRDGQGGLLGFFRRIGEKKQNAQPPAGRSRFILAGFNSPSAPAIYYGARLCLAFGLPVVAGLFPVVWGLEPLLQVILLSVLTASGYLLPSIYLDSRTSARKGSITRALPDALDLMVVCVEAGLGINQSLARVSQEFAAKSPELSREFALVGYETRAGKTTTEALRGLAERTGVSDVSSLVALLVQTERFGTSVANALRVHADAMRIRRMQRAEERAQKAALKLIFPSALIFAALLMIFLFPGMIEMANAMADMGD